jgi:tripartite-type tricarboxylate transporter receptor subunit TctC
MTLIDTPFISTSTSTVTSRPARSRRLAADNGGRRIGLPMAAHAQTAATFPSKPLTLLVPFPPGAATDAIARALAVPLARHLGQQVVVENRPGAAGTMAASLVAQSSATDGHTVAIAPATIFRVHLQKVPYDTLKDLSFIMNFGLYLLRWWWPRAPASRASRVRRLCQGQSGKVSIGASGADSTGHIATPCSARRPAPI